MNSLSQTGRQYLRAVRKRLDAPRGDRERLMRRLTGAVSAYLEENPGASPEELAAAVGGPPDRCAAELLAELDPAVVSACRRRKRLYLYLLIAALLVLVVFLACLAKSLYENGGLVIIERGHYESAEDMPPPPKEGTMIIEYHYDD